MNKIVLVGFPGSGKTTVGKSLAKKVQYTFVDLDEEIENRFHTSIAIMIEKYGEETFRRCEQLILKELLSEENNSRLVIATGGGAPCFDDNMELINENSISIYLEMTIPALANRLTNAKKRRPLIQKYEGDLRQYIGETLTFRESFYKRANITVNGENIDIKKLAEEISPFLENHQR